MATSNFEYFSVVDFDGSVESCFDIIDSIPGPFLMCNEDQSVYWFLGVKADGKTIYAWTWDK